MGNVVPMDSKLPSNCWYMAWPSRPNHISKLGSHRTPTPLKGRKQSVVIGGNVSGELPVLSGVLQGSILGPTLIARFIENYDHLILQRDIDYLFDWAIRNKMQFPKLILLLLIFCRLYNSIYHGEKDP